MRFSSVWAVLIVERAITETARSRAGLLPLVLYFMGAPGVYRVHAIPMSTFTVELCDCL